ncbi:hypothetical protein B0F90DRAFT_1700325 [Multifurca ochricompacta]|uniref:Uncharacterized protein n=1 Tax=Multifurca ochricompacta TaxID=376703 RepID=A0AAD4QQT7_9AGAM|nr:hypothetical protein B0F90DRAFT_1700325 [Multifurca ochricompacta]
MILLDEDSSQRPKLSAADPAAPSPSEPAPSPDYETSEAQDPSHHKLRGGGKFWNTRVGKLISYALVFYSSVLFVVGVPTFVLKWRSSHKFRWHADDSFSDYPLPPPPPLLGSQIDLSSQALGQFSLSCNTWAESVAVPGDHNSTAGIASMRLAFPLGEGILLRTNSSPDNLRDYVSGSLMVDMNPDKTISGTVLVANARYSDFQLFKSSSVCLTNVENTTEILLHIPDKREGQSDNIHIDLRLLFPWTPTPISLNLFATHLPMFKQNLSNLGSLVVFEHLKLAGSSSTITVGSTTAASIVVRTSGAEISGNFSASEKIILDTINGAVYANVSLINSKKLKRPTKLTVETGNGPIVAHVTVEVDERVYFMTPKHHNVLTKFKTFNAPMNVSIAHVPGSKPARLGVLAENTQGAMNFNLDSLYTGTFDLRSKEATTMVQEAAVPVVATSFLTSGDGERELHFEHVSPEWTFGWIGGDRRPEKFDRHALGRVELFNSLSPVELRLAQSRTSTTIRR